jgi:BclB C-terminal domain-containing protein
MSNIALQIEKTTAGAVAMGANVIFDTTLFINGDIGYDDATGTITFEQPGRYALNWWVATQASRSATGAMFALSTSENDLIMGNSPLKTGETSGIAVIEVVDAPVTASLVNASPNEFFFSTTVPVAASLVIVEDDEQLENGSGAIIPFSSGTPLAVTTIAGGLVGFPALVGFGSSIEVLTVLGISIDLSGLTNFAFSMPRDGVITSLSAFFSVTVGLSLIGTDFTLRAQLYRSTAPNNIFTPIPQAVVDMALPGLLNVGDTFNATVTGLDVGVTNQTRLLLVISAEAQGLSLLNTITGYVSAGVNIA